ncbi:hypothetical protein Celaphus_00012050 [Cervus elaphus hippelaphus]|uniref:Small ribosomal subunit protein eS7 n=1 Tax=Cervus elaphus hippelaphus TaxID=46360 RepID=A0A212CKL0_CEREH|nr:hypothetical protein Celaphus_00012050 [Cervus elaphus hippelaphus]
MVHLDKAQQNNVEHKVETFSRVYKKLMSKDVNFEVPEFQLFQFFEEEHGRARAAKGLEECVAMRKAGQGWGREKKPKTG